MSETAALESIGFIGLGRMGTPMAARLVGAGHRVSGYDVAEPARDRLAELGGSPVLTLAEAAAAEVIILMLPDSATVMKVLRDAGLSSALRGGTTIIDMSSSDPVCTREISREVGARGVRYVDAPVSGGVNGAQDGKLTIMVGAPDADFAAIAKLLAPLGRVVHAGDVGSGHAIKALNNLLSATHLLATAEAIKVGERFGLDPKIMLNIFNSSSGRSGSTENKWPNFILNEKYNSGFSLRLMAKDMKIATRLAEAVGVAMPLGDEARLLWERAAEELPATADHTEIAAWAGEEREKPALRAAAAGSMPA